MLDDAQGMSGETHHFGGWWHGPAEDCPHPSHAAEGSTNPIGLSQVPPVLRADPDTEYVDGGFGWLVEGIAQA